MATPGIRGYIPFYRWIRFFGAVALGRNAYPFGQVFRGYRDEMRQHAVADEVHRTLKFLERDASGAERWATAFGEFWIPKGANPRFLAGVLAEQVREVY